MIRPGDVGSVRELMGGGKTLHRVQAEVVLGSDAEHGTAKVTVETRSPAVMEALAALHAALRDEAAVIMGKQLEGQKAWDAEMDKSRDRRAS